MWHPPSQSTRSVSGLGGFGNRRLAPFPFFLLYGSKLGSVLGSGALSYLIVRVRVRVGAGVTVSVRVRAGVRVKVRVRARACVSVGGGISRQP